MDAARREVRAELKRLTLHVEMRCNSYCIFCGQRAVDPAMIKVRQQLGLSVPQTKLSFGSPERLAARREQYERDRGRLPVIRGAIVPGYTFDAAVETLRVARHEGYGALNLQGGEPTIWPGLPELIAKSRELGFESVTVVTNGRKLADPDYARAVVDAGVTTVVLSLLASSAATHDDLAQSPGSFDSLVQAAKNLVELARSGRAPQLQVWSNVITSAESVDGLPEEVELLSGLGLNAGSLHLIRFEYFADDPIVRRRLSFPIERIRAPLARALELADAAGFLLQAEDIPLCLHPSLQPAQVDALLSRAATEHRQHTSPVSENQVVRSPHVRTSACDGCMFDASCRRVPSEYLPGGADGVFRPIGAATIAASIDAENPDAPGSRGRLDGLTRSVGMLRDRGLLDDAAFETLIVSLRNAYARRMEHARASADERETLDAFMSLLGLRPHLRFTATGRLLDRAASLEPQLRQRDGARNGDPRRAPTAPGEHRVVFGPGYEVIVKGTARDGVLHVDQLRPVYPPPSAPGGTLGRALYLLYIWPRLQQARALRFSESSLDVDEGHGFAVAFTRATRWAVHLE